MTITIIVLDSVGLGALDDAAKFGDDGAHTLDHTLEATGAKLPNFKKLGLGTIEGVNRIEAVDKPQAAYGRLNERSPGKDTTTGHWEFMGVVLEHAFQTFPAEHPSFPKEVMEPFEVAIGRGTLGNYAASGTVIIEDLGEDHLETGKPIVYTSSDSVFQIACHTEVAPVETLYEWCEEAREILQGDHAVARVIARPFEGELGNFKRIGAKRKDFSLTPPHNVINVLGEAGKAVIGIGKIPDIFSHVGFSEEIKTNDNLDGVDKTIEAMKKAPDGLIFTNLVEFDSLYGHRRNPEGYAGALKDVDERLPQILDAVPQNGILIFTSDHGNDPTWTGSDHTREYGMLLVYGPKVPAVDLGTRKSFADIGATVADLLGVEWDGEGESFAAQLKG